MEPAVPAQDSLFPQSTESRASNAESLQSLLDLITGLHIDLVCSTSVDEEQVRMRRDLLLTFKERQTELQELKKVSDALANDPERMKLGE